MGVYTPAAVQDKARAIAQTFGLRITSPAPKCFVVRALHTPRPYVPPLLTRMFGLAVSCPPCPRLCSLRQLPTRRSFAPLRRPHALESACFRLTRGSGGTTTHTLRVRAPHPLRAPLGSSASRGGYIHSTGKCADTLVMCWLVRGGLWLTSCPLPHAIMDSVS